MSDRRVFDSADALAEGVAEAFIERLAALQAEGREPAVALTGGTIARELHRAVAASPARKLVDWRRVDFWFGDERYVDSGSEERNAGQARVDLLDQVGVDPERVHEMPSTESGLTLEDAATAYADEVRSKGDGAFDLVLLGLGPDGHVASLFPGHAALRVDDAIAVAVRDSPKPPPERISLTFSALNRTPATWFLVSGEAKAEAVARTLSYGTSVYDVPAAGIAPAVDPHEVVWWLDRAAASRL